jgi:hypothetical protein
MVATMRAAHSAGSPPPCGEGSGVGVLFTLQQLPPSLTLPRKGGGNAPVHAARLWAITVRALGVRA